MRLFEMQPFLDAISRFNITEVPVVTPILTSILSSPFKNKPLLRSLRYIHCGGAPLDPKIQLRMYDILPPGAIVGQVWGLTELGWTTQFQWPERDDTGSVGRQGPSQEIK
jgi:acyl-CoA synthetase (AMP-forming)/AMP-acid ligase II